MECLSICFEEKCRLQHKQIFSAQDRDSQLHSLHNVESIHPHSTFIRSLTTKPIKFKEKYIKVYAQLQEQYNKSVERAKQALMVCFQQCERRIMNVYELSEKEVNLTLIEPHLKHKTQQTELWLTLMNWKKAHKTENMQNYIEHLPKTLIKEYKTTTNKLVDSLFPKIPKSPYNIYDHCHKPNIQELQAYVKNGSRVIQEISQQISYFYDCSNICEIPLIKKGIDTREEILKQLAQVFCNSKSTIQYRDIDSSLLVKLQVFNKIDHHVESSILVWSIFRKVLSGIDKLIKKDFKYQSIRTQINKIRSDLKDCRTWMHRNEVNIFIRCVRFFMDIDRAIVINPHQIYIIYVVIIIRIMQRRMKNKTLLPLNSPTQRLERDVIYLFYHFGHFDKVKEIVTRQYSSAQLMSVGQLIKKTWKNIVVDTYNDIKENENIQNTEFSELVFQEQDFCHQQFWDSIVRQYINYRLKGKLDQTERESLEQTMMIVVVRNRQALQGFSNQKIDASLNNGTEDKIDCFILPVVSNVSTIVEEKTQSMQCSSIIQMEQLPIVKFKNQGQAQQGRYFKSELLY